MSRVFTPRRMAAIEPQVRAYAARTLDPLVGTGGFDFIADLGAEIPMRTIGMLLGIPEEDQQAIRDHIDEGLRLESGVMPEVGVMAEDRTASDYGAYIEWRAQHPSDDLMTELLTAEFTDETGTVRTLTRDEILGYIGLLSGAGNETTTRLIGWFAKILAENPEQRAELVADRSLIPAAIEEVLRLEPPGPHVARFMVKDDMVVRGEKIPAESIMLFLLGAANRDDRRWANGDDLDIHREPQRHLTFGNGIHLCLGAALARMEGQVALDEVLTRFPTWDVDLSNARLSPTSTVRGWESMPAVLK
jgi:cytochrome P450